MTTGCCDAHCDVHRAKPGAKHQPLQCKYELTPIYDARGLINMTCPACVRWTTEPNDFDEVEGIRKEAKMAAKKKAKVKKKLAKKKAIY